MFCEASRTMRQPISLIAGLVFSSISIFAESEAAKVWRQERRLIDLHQHIGYSEAFMARAIRVMDASGIGIGANLSGGPTLSRDGNPSPFERNKALADRLFPGRFV